MTILDQLTAYARIRVQQAKEMVSLDAMIAQALNTLGSSNGSVASCLSKCVCSKSSDSQSCVEAGSKGYGALVDSTDSDVNGAVQQDAAVRTAASSSVYRDAVDASRVDGVYRNAVDASSSAVDSVAENEIGASTSVTAFAFEMAIQRRNAAGDIAFICECKKASPSKGIIDPHFDYMAIAKSYEAAGADCISVLTEPKWFLGHDEYLREIASAIATPCLRKDFIVDEYQVYEAKVLGASAVLLICSVLSDKALRRMLAICDDLGLSALVEAHDADEVRRAIKCGARMIGVNNRNLKDFSVDTSNSKRLRALVPHNVIFVAESGVQSQDDVSILADAGVNAILVGESLMRAEDKSAKLHSLRNFR